MSAPSFYQYSQPIWMQNNYSNQAFNGSSDAYSQEQSNQYHTPWQYYEDGSNYSAQSVNQPTQSPQSHLRPHRRALSNSTNGSYGSVRSPYSHPSSVSYPAGFDNSYLDPNYDTCTNLNQYQKHLPTPSHTPTQESYMENRGYNRRNKPAINTDSNVYKALRPMMSSHASSDADGQGLPSSQTTSGYGQEMPATPRTMSQDQGDDQYNAASSAVLRRVPNFDRTMSDIYQDELYNPAAVQSIPAPRQGQAAKNPALLSPFRTIVTDRLNAANEARSLNAPASRISREPSPFRQTSPYSATGHGYGPIGTAAAIRQQQKAEADALAYQQHHPQPEDTQIKTISPKDAVLDFHDQADETGPPLFPQTSATSDGQSFESQSRGYAPLNGGRQQAQPTYALPSSTFNFQTPTAPASAHIPNNIGFKFAPPQYRPTNSEDSQEQPDFPAHLVSMETTRSEPEGELLESDMEKPSGATADGGTYTCTYHGCSQRFASPMLLQKHKREGHRASVTEPSQAQPLSPEDSGSPNSAAAQLRNSQAGPHKCDRINPSTGKPCNTIFSRPYDLTRHEDTIHAQRAKVRCQYCVEDKTFSRSDALTRHMRVVHPNVEFMGKITRKRHIE